jgi:hypothetical protein
MAKDHMQINQRIVGDVAIVEVIGDIVANSGDVLLRKKPALPLERAGICATRRDDPRSEPPDFHCFSWQPVVTHGSTF